MIFTWARRQDRATRQCFLSSADAVATEARAIIAAQTAGPAELVPDLQRRLEVYRGGQKFRDESR